jgi:hypothetical protein
MHDKFEKLKMDYEKVSGHPLAHFFCPILFRDEHVDLCKAHIINLAFPASSRAWTVQRKDVDNFYGTYFESEFVITHKNWTLGDTITDKTLAKKLNPKFLVEDKSVEFFKANSDIPKHFSHIEFDNNGQIVHLGLKMSPAEVISLADSKWEISISKDIRIPALVSLIKAAHLTLFEILGYNYVLSTGGYFVGRQILGEFYIKNCNAPKPIIEENAHQFFREFAHMVRPIQSTPMEFQGTITDKLLLICKEGQGKPWAFIVFIKIAQWLHAVMIPILDQPDTVAKFVKFLHSDNDIVEITLSRFCDDHWEIDKGSSKLHWPKDGVLYPE